MLLTKIASALGGLILVCISPKLVLKYENNLGIKPRFTKYFKRIVGFRSTFILILPKLSSGTSLATMPL